MAAWCAGADPLSTLRDKDVHVGFSAEFPNATVQGLPGGRERLESFVRVFKDELATVTNITSSESLEVTIVKNPPLVLEGRAVFRGIETPFPHTDEALAFLDKLMPPPVVAIQIALLNALEDRGYGDIGNITLAAQGRPTIHQDVAVVTPQGPVQTVNEDTTSFFKENPEVLAATLAVGGLLLALLVTVWWYMFRQRCRRKAAEKAKQKPADPTKPTSPWGGNTAGKLRLPSNNHIQIDKLDLIEKIGSGSFKTVFRGKWGSNDVAIARMRKGGVVLEARLMDKLQSHPNLVTFYRWTQDQKGNEYIVMELIRGGSLDKFLRQRAGQTSLECKVAICDQICQAMSQLAKENVLHRDLAARNVLVQSLKPPCVKVSDFGLSKYVSPSIKSQISSGCIMNHLPVRWIPPEVMRHLEWSEKSDVWAFGVTLWEVFSDGKEPYAAEGLSDVEVVDKVLKGEHLPKPAGCPEAMYEMMLDCWHAKPSDRPNFTELARRFHVSERILAISSSSSPKSETGGPCSTHAASAPMEGLTDAVDDLVHDAENPAGADIQPMQPYSIDKVQPSGRPVSETDIQLVAPISWNSEESAEFSSVLEDNIKRYRTAPGPGADYEASYPVDFSEASTTGSLDGVSSHMLGGGQVGDRPPLASVPEYPSCDDGRGGTDTRPLLNVMGPRGGEVGGGEPVRCPATGPYRSIKDVVDGG
eukprot:evm.model.scf_47.1 EVM.evm.TU.scf_47.1   scf_47:4525-13989(-)